MIDSRNTALDLAPKAFDGVGMDITGNINSRGMLNAGMVISNPAKSVVGPIFVRVDNRTVFHRFLDHGDKGSGFRILHCFGLDSTFALNYPDNGGFPLSTASTLTGTTATEVRFIDFNFTGKLVVAFVKSLTDQFAHSPSRLVRHSGFPFNLLGRYSAPSLGHEVDGIEPKGKASGRLMKDRIGGGMNVMAAFLTTIGAA